MALIVATVPGAAHPDSLRIAAKLAKVTPDLPKNLRKLEEWRKDADECRLAIKLAGIDDKEAAADLGLTASQLSEQLAGRERPQTERFRHSDRMRGPYLMAQAIGCPELFDVVTTITVKR